MWYKGRARTERNGVGGIVVDLHTAVRMVARKGIAGGTSEARLSASLSKAEQAAFRAWRRRLRAKGEATVGIIPPASAFEWTVKPQPATPR